MKRIASLIAMLVALSAAPASAEPIVASSGFVGQAVVADWMLPRKGAMRPLRFIAGVREIGDDGEIRTFAVLGRGACYRPKRSLKSYCWIRERIKNIPHENFVFDPTMSTATLTVTHRGVTHGGTWTGGTEVLPIHSAGAGTYGYGSEYAGAGADAFGVARRDATSDAKVYGRRFAAAKGFAYLIEGAGGYLFAGSEDGEEISRGDSVTIRRFIRT